MTNRDRINKMSNKEMAKALNNDNGCDFCIFSKYEFCHGKHIDGKNVTCEEAIEMWLEKEEEQTADEMFKELGYEKIIDNSSAAKYQKNEKNETQLILIYIDEYETCRYARYCNYQIEEGKWIYGDYEFITEEENKAIQKKIEELKNGKQ